VDVPSYLEDRIGEVIAKTAAYSNSAECLGYPHALFRAHSDIRITEQEGHFMKLELMSLISEMGLSKSQFEMLIKNYHDVLETRSGV
jgi:NurA-like 5'-3' nuclease